MVEAVRDKRSWLYSVAYVLAKPLFRFFLPVKVHHPERLNREGPSMIISNHLHALDPVMIASFVRGTQVVFLGKKELGVNKTVRSILTRCHCILVDRHNTDMEAMRACMKAMKTGKTMIIFPEGTRHHEGQMEQIENGASFIVLRSRVPVIPVYIGGPMKFLKKTEVWVGEPIPCDDLFRKGVNMEACEELNERFRETFRAMIRDAEQKNEKN